MKNHLINRSIGIVTTLIGLSILAGCAQDADLPKTPDDVIETNLAALVSEDARPSGLAIDAESGQRYLLDPTLGIMELKPDGEVISVWSPSPELPQLTDLCSVGGGRFIAAADGDGYIIDLAAGAARQHFCLEPGWDPGFDPEGETKHLNRSVACDVQAGLIYGQPLTVLKEDENRLLRSEVASYLLSTGADQQWVSLPTPNYHAGGMTMLRTGTLLLGAGTQLSSFDTHNGTLNEIADLGRYGVGRIEAITTDVHANTVLVVDGSDNTLVEIPMERLGL